jgi:FkbM family methyltransferase
MLIFLKKTIKKFFKFFGYKLVIFKKKKLNIFLNIKDEETLISLVKCKGVMHLGAHKGEEADIYQWLGKKVIWIEAIPKIFDELKDNLYFYNNQKAYCLLLGDMDNVKKSFFISNNDSMSSSLFKFSQNTLDGKYFSDQKLRITNEIILEMSKLDTFVKKNSINISDYNHWILDLQGAELLALKGAENSLKFCDSLLIEVSKVNIYENGVLWLELKDWLIKRNFYPVTEPLENHSDILFKKNNVN